MAEIYGSAHVGSADPFGWQARISRDPMTDRTVLHVWRYAFGPGGKVVGQYAALRDDGLHLLEFGETDEFPGVTMELGHEPSLARAITQALIIAGYGPPQAPSEARMQGALESMKAHLADMRSLVFDPPKVRR